jgi:hypothetical protein
MRRGCVRGVDIREDGLWQRSNCSGIGSKGYLGRGEGQWTPGLVSKRGRKNNA